MEHGPNVLEIACEPGVHTKWSVVITEHSEPGHSGPQTSAHLVAGLLAVEQLIADRTCDRADSIGRTVYTLGGRGIDFRDGSSVEFRWQPVTFDWRCMDCGVLTDALGEYYMVHDALWRQVNADDDGHLCVGCLEARLGRRLSATDFTDVAANSSAVVTRSARLIDRLGRG